MNDLRKAFHVIVKNPDLFREDFGAWIQANFHVYTAFESEANKVRALGFKDYGHRTIWEYLRHETRIREVSGQYKLNDHYTKSCAQLYLLLHPDAGEFFEFRERVAA